MKNDLVGKQLLNEKDESFTVLAVVSYKGINCAYCKNATCDGKFFQISLDNQSLVSIESKKILNALTECLKNEEKNREPRKINEGESVTDYLTYLDDFYKTKIISID